MLSKDDIIPLDKLPRKQDVIAVYVRPEVAIFARKMHEKLNDNDHKGGWDNCSFEFLMGRLLEEVSELYIELYNGNSDSVISEAADVANFAMMIADQAGKVNDPQ